MAADVITARETTHTLRPCTRSDLDQVQQLLNTSFPTDLFTREWLTWKYGGGNSQGPGLAVVGESDAGEIISFLGFWPRTLELDGQTLLVYQAVDGGVHPGYRREGLFSQMVDLAVGCARQAGAVSFFGFPNPISYAALSTLGWTALEPLRWWIRALPGVQSFRQWQPVAFDALELRATPTPGARIRLARDEDYLRWRYQRRPGSSYRFWDLGSIRGEKVYAVTSDKVKMGLPQTFVVDLVGVPLTNADQLTVLDALVSCLTRLGKPLGILDNTLSCDAGAFHRRGFVRVPKKGRNCMVQPLTEGGRSIPFADMQVCPGDMDTF